MNSPDLRDAIDRQFARLMRRLGHVDDPALVQLFAELSHALTQQHSCIDLAGRENEGELCRGLASLPVVGGEDDHTPLVLQGSRLFLRRYFDYEIGVAERLATMNREVDCDETVVRQALDRCFPQASRQKLAAAQALTRQLTIIAGGPGTGKTSTVANILKSIRETSEEEPAIALAAPTGKAAMRLSASLSEIPALPEVKTLHRLLGFRHTERTWRHHADSPLAANLLIVDEVSMIDLAMMHRLLDALRPDARLILLGDPGQLPSVEAGNILADLCKYGFPFSVEGAERLGRLAGIKVTGTPASHRLCDALCELDQSYRFSPHRGIGRLSRMIRGGDENFPVTDDEEVELQVLDALTPDTLIAIYGDYLEAVRDRADAATLARLFDQVRILSPLRDGDFGVSAINGTIELRLIEAGLATTGQPFYHGRPVLVTRNDYNLKLFNGDIGITVAERGETPHVVFPGIDGERSYLASRLPMHESCFAMTVHKSQGSEFDHVVLALPRPATESQAALLTREMLYTAITRARHKVSLFCDDDVLAGCLRRHTVRHSGLGERLVVQRPPDAEPPHEQRGQLDLF